MSPVEAQVVEGVIPRFRIYCLETLDYLPLGQSCLLASSKVLLVRLRSGRRCWVDYRGSHFPALSQSLVLFTAVQRRYLLAAAVVMALRLAL